MIITQVETPFRLEMPPMIRNLNKKRSSILHFLGVRIIGFKRRMQGSPITIRLCQPTDLPALRFLLNPEIFVETSGIRFQTSSFPSFCKWILTTFPVVYIIDEIDENRQSRIIGFLGLYHMKIGESLWVSLAIFDPKDRRRGYGSQAFELLLSSLKRNGAARAICAGVLAANEPSLSFFRKLGFRVYQENNGMFLLKKVIEESLED